MKKLAIITTHPIQYNAPIFRLLAERNKIRIKVFYTWENSRDKVYDKKFGREIKWDIPLLEGYDYKFVKNISKDQGSHHYKGIDNPTLNKEIEKWDADAVLIYGWKFKSHFKTMRYFKGKIPVFFRGDSTLLDEVGGLKSKLRRIVLKKVYKNIDFAFYVGTNNKKYFLKHGLRDKQLIFAPHAIDNDRFYDKDNKFEEKAKKWRQELGVKDKDIVFLFVGKFEAKKNPMLLIESAKKLPEYKFLFVGNGELEDDMKTNAGKNVLFLPFQNQSIMPVVYRLGDVYVLPSKGPGETWGLAVNEAMACGKAVLVSDKVGCAVDLVENNENGYIFKSNDLNDLIKKIKLFENSLKKFGEKSFKIIKNWSFKIIVETIEEKVDG